ncbi:MAG: PDZ domain-containing protein [Pirellulaceae bacterium]
MSSQTLRPTYSVDFSQAARHLALVQLQLPTGELPELTLVFPVWTPGSYMIREYTRNLESIRIRACSDLAGLVDQPVSELVPTRQGKNRWQIRIPRGCRSIRVEYEIYCRENTVRTNWIERDYGFLTGASTFPFLLGREQEEICLRLQLPVSWTDQATALHRQASPSSASNGGAPSSNCVEYLATNYDELVDAPIVCGKFPIRQFEVGGHQHFLANVAGDELWDLDRATADMQTIIREHHRFWGVIPYKNYWFLNLCTEAGGGLEHDNSTVLMCSRWTMRRRETYLNWLALVSHEFFHTWNVRRLRPRALMRYDYEQEQFFEELWIAEGITSYFDDLCLVRTGLCTRDEYLSRLTANIQAVQNSPGRLVQNLADASWDTWTKHYRPDENTPNSRISYYLKGAILAWLLDAQLQQTSERAINLADVMCLLWQRHLDTGYTLHDFNTIVEELGTPAIRKWLERNVHRAEELDLQPALDWFGLRLQELEAPHVEKAVAKVWIGSESTGSDGRLFVRRVFRNSPSDRAGLNVDDELISFDGYRVTPDTWPSRLEVYEPEQEIELLVSRRGKILNLKIVLGHKPKHNWQLEVDPSASPEAVANQNVWLRLPQKKPSVSSIACLH